ncbi:MAG: energy transducer TonB [Sphingopyxis sp.]|nr:energy transducer TonB [Sphingopyxis sp.]
MTLIPLISAIVVAPETATAPGGGPVLRRSSYDGGGGHRPLAAALAIGLPAALVVAVALSPMIIDTPPRVIPEEWESFPLPKPKPPERQPDAKPQERTTETTPTTTESPLPPLGQDPPTGRTDGPPVPPSGTGTGPTVIVEPAPPPPLVLAELDKRFLDDFQPDYPMREQRGEIEGIAKVRVLIGTDGRVKQVELVSTDSPGFFEQTKRRALSKWRFKPATRGGVAEESWKVMTVRFEIKNA